MNVEQYNELLRFSSRAIAKIPTDVKEVVDKYDDTYLAGGYFSSILNKLEPKDYDVFTSLKYAKDIISQLIDKDYTVKVIQNPRHPNQNEYGYLNLSKTARYVLNKNDTEIDLVVCKDDPLKIINRFDLSACKIWYDGESIRARDICQFINRKSTLTVFKEGRDIDPSTNSWKRYIRYYSKGFEIEIVYAEKVGSNIKSAVISDVRDMIDRSRSLIKAEFIELEQEIRKLLTDKELEILSEPADLYH